MTELPYKYKVQYAHQDERKPADDPNRHGWGEIEYESERPVVTAEELKAVAQWIAKPDPDQDYRYTAVGIIKFEQILDGDAVQSITDVGL